MKILVTGGAGYIGSELVKRLVSSDKVEVVKVYDNLSRPNYNMFIGKEKPSSKIEFIQGELLDTRTLKRSLDGVDMVYHCAARVTTPFSDLLSHSFEQINHWGTAELVYALEELGIANLVHISSSSVYGSSPSPVSIKDDCNPKTFYGISKRRAEEHIDRFIASGGNAHIIRCGNVFGYSPCMRFDTVINRMLFDAHFKGRIKVHGSGEQYRAFVHIDTVSQFLSTLTDSGLNPGVYDLTENNYKVNDIAKALKEIYPEMEMLFIDQNMKMREVQVSPDSRIEGSVQMNSNALVTMLEEFKGHFSF